MTSQTVMRAAHHEDASSLAAVATAARASNDLETVMYPGGLTPSQLDERAASHASDIAAPNSVVLAALDSAAERIVGFIHWREVLDGHITAEMESAFLGAWTGLPALDELAARNWRVYKSTMEDHPHICLESIYVHPDYQRKGIGSALLQRCLSEADNKHAAIYLEATKEGAPLYERKDFTTIRVNDMDLTVCGGGEITGLYQNFVMVRKARS